MSDLNHCTEADIITAYSIAALSKCFSGHVGCLIRSPSNAFIINACNAPLSGKPDCYQAGGCMMRFDGKKERCVRTVHAEMRAAAKVLRTGGSLAGAILVQTKQPCSYCAKFLAEMGVAVIYYVEPNTTLPSIGVEIFLPMKIIRVDKPKEKIR